jgi:hypothetical protein
VQATKKGDGIRSARLLKAEEMTVSVFTCQGAILADSITVTYLESESEGEEKEEEFHGSLVASDCEEIGFQNSKCKQRG